jgi:hypothetical protein
MNKMDSLRTTFNFINPSSQTHPQLFKRWNPARRQT